MAKGITQKQVLVMALNLVTDDPDRWEAEAERYEVDADEARSVLAHIVQQASKSKPKKESLKAQENRAFLADRLGGVESGTTFTAKSFAEENDITSAKASSILRLGVADGLLSVDDSTKGAKRYIVK